MPSAYIYDGLRTPFGRCAGKLASIRPDDLLALVIQRLLANNKFLANEINDVIVGNANQAGEDSRNIARHAALLAGLPVSVPGITVNRLCGSGIAAILDASRAICCDEGRAYIAGGVEVMSRAPWVIARSEKGYTREIKVEDSTLGARFPNPRLIEAYGNDTMPQTADNVARYLDIAREQCDTFALMSQQKYGEAKKKSFFDSEIIPVSVPDRKLKKGFINVEDDEHPRLGSTLEKLGKLEPINKGGVVTAGNASGINDGAAALIVGSETLAHKIGMNPRVRIVSSAVSGIEPRLMGLGPVAAINFALSRANLSMADMDVIEINEAFAAQVIGCLIQLKIPLTDSRLNSNGGAIALGHPLGASGARLVITAMRQLEASSGRYALISMCIGVGQGIAIIIERV